MGIIRKILDRELVGGTTNEEIYPISSTKAIYDENNKNLDYILNLYLRSIESLYARQGFYICDSNSIEPDKEIQINNFVLSTTIRLLVKMTKANIADNVSFEINNTGAYPLYYNDAPAASNNTWEEGEVLDIYFDGTYFKAFSSNIKDEEGIGDSFWELKTDKNGLQYIYTKFPIIGASGLTLYSSESILVPSIFEGLPIDNDTIYWEENAEGNRILKSKGGTGGGGVSNWEDLQGKPEWITDTAPNNNIFPNTANYWVADNNKISSWDNAVSKAHEHANKATLDKIYEKDGVIYWDGSLAVTGGITAYALGDVEVSTIMDGVVVDGTTIKKENGKLVVIGGSGSSFDEAAMWATLSAATDEQINKSHLTTALTGYATESWVQGKGYALQTSLDAVSAKLNDFLEGSDTDTIINKWKELEAFLEGMSETDNLAEILSNKADTSYVNDELAKYVTLATDQSISGAKTFTSLLTTAAITASGDISTPNVRTSDSVYINGIRLYKSADGTIKIDGNLLVTGGITAYSTGDEGGSSGGGGIDVEVLWEILGGTGDQQINIAHLTDALIWDNVSNKPTTFTPSAHTHAISDITSLSTELGKKVSSVTVTGTGNAITSASVSGHKLTLTKDSTFSLSGHTHNYIIDAGNANKKITFAYSKAGISRPPWMAGWNGYELRAVSTDLFWHADNDGSGSGLDADTVDGVHNGSLTARQFNINDGVLNFDTLSGNAFFSWRINATSRPANYGTVLQFSNRDNTTPGADNHWVNQFAWGTNDRIYVRQIINTESWTSWHTLAYTSDNVYSATKLQTPRTINGTSFDGTANITTAKWGTARNIYIRDASQAYTGAAVSVDGSTNEYLLLPSTITASLVGNADTATKLKTARTIWGQSFDGTGNVNGNLTINNSDIVGYGGAKVLQNLSGNLGINPLYNVGIGTTSPSYKLDVNGDMYARNAAICDIYINRRSDGVSTSGVIECYAQSLYLNYYSDKNIILGIGGGNVGIGISSPSAKLHVAGNILATGGITCYASDQRAKTVIEQISLSLKQIANAPTIRFKWNDWKIKDDGKTHIGGIAQYMQKLLPETVLEADDMLNMDYATTGYIFAVQTAKYLVKTDTEVEKLKKRVKKLEKQLKQLGYEEANIMDD